MHGSSMAIFSGITFQIKARYRNPRPWYIVTGDGTVNAMDILLQEYSILTKPSFLMNLCLRLRRNVIGVHLILSPMTILGNKCISAFCVAAIALGTLTGCDVYEWVKSPSYVDCYVNLESINLSVETSDPQCIRITHGSDFLLIAYGLRSKGAAEKEKYDQLCKKHNDLSYNKYRSLSKHVEYDSVTYAEYDFTEITVTSDKDYDAAHPAGESLSDIVRFMSWSPYRYILSGYSRYYHYDKSDVSDAFDTMMRIYINREYFDNATDATCYPVDKLVKDLTAGDLVLLGHDYPDFLGMLYFEKKPDGEGEHNITVTMRTDTDKVLSNTVRMPF